jgi:glycosyltransferase involved in cell wall biosynthesis
MHPGLYRALPAKERAKDVARFDSEFQLADRILVGSTFVMATLLDKGVPREKIRVIPYGTDTNKFSPSGRPVTRSGPLKIVSVASVTPAKGTLDVVQAFSLLPRDVATLTLVGSAPNGLAWLGDAPYHYLGRIPHADLPEVLSGADGFVLASWFEGLPLSVLEALAAGLPCVVTERGGDQAVRHGVEGFVVPAGSPSHIASAIQRWTDPLIRQQQSFAARKRAEELSWERYISEALGEITTSRE